MCAPAALETLLRGTLRKVGVDCVAIAVDATSFTAGGDPVDCTRVPTRTRIAQTIQDGRVAIAYATDGDPLAPDCQNRLLEQAINTVIFPSITEGVNVVDVLAIGGESACPTDCTDDGVGLWERFMGSVRVIEEDSLPRLLVVEAASGDALDCDDMTPTETLLKSAFVRQADGGWAMRIFVEA